jgi:hypothetical protein
MAEESKIAPAMTSKQWDEVRRFPPGLVWFPADEGSANRHQVAALCLYQQPFGFTAEDVAQLFEVWLEGTSTEPDPEPHPKDTIGHDAWVRRRRRDAFLRSLGARIAALLPPDRSEG